MFVSRKTLALIHFLARKLPACIDLAEHSVEEGIDLRLPSAFLSGRKFGKPVAKHLVQSGIVAARQVPGVFDQVFLRTEGDIFHLYESSVH